MMIIAWIVKVCWYFRAIDIFDKFLGSNSSTEKYRSIIGILVSIESLMTHQWKLGTGHQISIDNEGALTIVNVLYGGSDAQQRVSNTFTTGIWISPPEMSLTLAGAILKVTTPSGVSKIEVEGNSVRLQNSQSEADGFNYSSSSSSVFNPIEPLQSIVTRPDDLELNIDMVPQAKSFCTQCGTPVKPVDRFCSGCGHKLGS